MKKSILVLLALSFLAGAAFAADAKAADTKLEALMAPGDIALSAGLGYGIFWGAIDVSGGAEYIIGQFKVGDTLPLSYGAAVKVSYFGWDGGKVSYFGGGAFGTLHLGLKDLGLADNMLWLANVDTYVGLGLGLYGYGYYDNKTELKVGLRAAAGVSYFITPKIAILTEGGYYGYYGSGLIGVLYKL
jgi:hypothetical protein